MSWFSLQINQNNRSDKLDEAYRRLGIYSQGMGCLSPISEVWKIEVIVIMLSTDAGLDIDFFIQDNPANTLFS